MLLKIVYAKTTELERLSGISTDGAHAMIGKEKGAIKLLIDKIESSNKTSNQKR